MNGITKGLHLLAFCVVSLFFSSTAWSDFRWRAACTAHRLPGHQWADIRARGFVGAASGCARYFRHPTHHRYGRQHLCHGSPIKSERWTGPGTPSVVLVSFTPDGSERWRYVHTWDHTNPDFQGSWSQLSVPIVVGDRVIIGHRYGVLRGVDRRTGKMSWERDLSPGREPITSSPVFDRAGSIYVHCRDIPTITKIDSVSGETLWTHHFGDNEIGHTSSPTLSIDEKTVYIGRTAAEISSIYAVNTDDGRFKWAWRAPTGRSHSFSWPIPVLASPWSYLYTG